MGEQVEEHFMVVTDTEFLLVDPHKTRLGFGVIHFIAFLQVSWVGDTPLDPTAAELKYVLHKLSLFVNQTAEIRISTFMYLSG